MYFIKNISSKTLQNIFIKSMLERNDACICFLECCNKLSQIGDLHSRNVLSHSFEGYEYKKKMSAGLVSWLAEISLHLPLSSHAVLLPIFHSPCVSVSGTKFPNWGIRVTLDCLPLKHHFNLTNYIINEPIYSNKSIIC